jgi:hypothetical protein
MRGIQERFLPEFTLRGCEKIRSWFDRLTTSGVPQWKFKYLPARPEPVEGQRLIFSQPLSFAERGRNDKRLSCGRWRLGARNLLQLLC